MILKSPALAFEMKTLVEVPATTACIVVSKVGNGVTVKAIPGTAVIFVST